MRTRLAIFSELTTSESQLIPYSVKLSREKTFINFKVLWLFAGVWHLFAAPASNPLKLSLRKSYFPPIHESFLLLKFPAIRQAVCHCILTQW